MFIIKLSNFTGGPNRPCNASEFIDYTCTCVCVCVIGLLHSKSINNVPAIL